MSEGCRLWHSRHCGRDTTGVLYKGQLTPSKQRAARLIRQALYINLGRIERIAEHPINRIEELLPWNLKNMLILQSSARRLIRAVGPPLRIYADFNSDGPGADLRLVLALCSTAATRSPE